MQWTAIEAFINTFEEKKRENEDYRIPLEATYRLIYSVIEDVQRFNGVEKLAECPVVDKAELFDVAQRVLNRETNALSAQNYDFPAERNKIQELYTKTMDKAVQLESEISSINKDKQAYDKLIEKIESSDSEKRELIQRYAVLQNAFNSLMSGSDNLKAVIQGGKAGDFSVKDDEDLIGVGMECKSLSDISGWMDKMQNRIEKLLSVYQKELALLVVAKQPASID